MTEQRGVETHGMLRAIVQDAVARELPLPSEKELAGLLGVGRNSVREALIRLEAEGFVVRRHGAGTFANPAALEVAVRIDRTAEFAEMLADAGVPAVVEVLEAGWTVLDAVLAPALRRPVGSRAFRTRKRWLAAERPIMVATDVVPVLRVADVDPAWSVFEISRALTGRGTDWVSSWVAPVLAGGHARDLDCEPGVPLLHLEQLGVTRDGTRCWWASEHHLPGELRYGLVRTVAQDGPGSSW
jgi:GntR family transcriptional regulator